MLELVVIPLSCSHLCNWYVIIPLSCSHAVTVHFSLESPFGPVVVYPEDGSAKQAQVDKAGGDEEHVQEEAAPYLGDETDSIHYLTIVTNWSLLIRDNKRNDVLGTMSTVLMPEAR